MKKRQIIISIIFISFTALVILLVLPNKKATSISQNKKTSLTQAIKYLKTKTIENKDFTIDIESYGRVISGNEINLISETQGILQSGDIEFKPGTVFKKGDLLVKIDDELANYNLKSLKSKFISKISELLPDIKNDFNHEYEKWFLFVENVDINKKLPELPNYETNREKIFFTSKNIISDYYILKAEEVKIEKYNIYAPFNGFISEVLEEQGTIVNIGKSIAKISKLNQNEVKVPIKLSDLKWIKKGQNVSLISEQDNAMYRGKIKRINKIVNSNTQSVDVFVYILDKSTIYQGMYFKIKIQSNIFKQMEQIPRRALINESSVYILKDSNLVKTQVHIVTKIENNIIIDNLKNGNEVVIEPVLSVDENMKYISLKQ